MKKLCNGVEGGGKCEKKRNRKARTSFKKGLNQQRDREEVPFIWKCGIHAWGKVSSF
jgi:hypothetical protein